MRSVWMLLAGVAVVAGCSEPTVSKRTPASRFTPGESQPVDVDALRAARKNEPSKVSVQHLLISFKGSEANNLTVSRSLEEAIVLANEVLAKAKAGDDFEALVVEFTDDGGAESKGNLNLVNFAGEGIDSPSDTNSMVVKRQDVVKAFGNRCFNLKIGEVGLVEYSPENSPFGLHVIKRIE